MSDAYELVFSKTYIRAIKRIKKKDKKLDDIIKHKVNEIVKNPNRYKNLKYDMSNLCRVHIGHFVLVFSVDDNSKIVTLEDFEHHDDIY